ncbi:MAG: hypothetical protein KAI28_01830, partial [Sphingomonadales bacterium]|nr:hypothetical protein [Sphingomonadales bacterium]
MVQSYATMGAALVLAGMAAGAQAKEIKSTYDVKQMTVQMDDGWQAVIAMKTAFALDTIMGEPKIMCAGTWEFQYALNPGEGGRYDEDNLPQSVIDDITLYNVDVLYDVG